MQRYDKLDFRLQSHDGYIIATMLINNIPLYDSIVSQHLVSTYESEQEREQNYFNFYFLETYPEEKAIDEETLFYYNFPQNLMPLDAKHMMIGLTPLESFTNFAKPLFSTYYFNLDNQYALQNSDTDTMGENGETICLVHTCGIAGCDYYQMKIERIASDKVIKWSNFKCANEPLHKQVNYIFSEENYLDVMLRIKQICDNVKNEKDYLEYKRFNYTPPNSY